MAPKHNIVQTIGEVLPKKLTLMSTVVKMENNINKIKYQSVKKK